MPEVILPERRAFLDAELQHQLQEFGFVRFQLLEPKQIQKLYDIYKELDNPELDHPFYTSNWSQDKDYRKRVDAQVRPILEKRLLGKLNNYKSCFGYFLVKRPSEQSEFKVHQDWSMVDETRYTGLTLWVPLADTSVNNGCFHIVRKSHLFSDHPRGSEIRSPYANIQDKIEKQYCTPIEMKAGEAILFDHRLWHYSPPNRSSQDRVAVGMVLIPEETTFIHHKKREDAVITMYETNDDFLIDIGFGDDISKCAYKVLKEYRIMPESYDLTTFKKMYSKYNGNESTDESQFKRLFRKLFAN